MVLTLQLGETNSPAVSGTKSVAGRQMVEDQTSESTSDDGREQALMDDNDNAHSHPHGSHGEQDACCEDCAIDALKGLPPCGMRGKGQPSESRAGEEESVIKHTHDHHHSHSHHHVHEGHGEEACCGQCALDALKGLPPCGMRGEGLKSKMVLGEEHESAAQHVHTHSHSHDHAHGSHGEEDACCADCAIDALKGLPPCGMRGKDQVLEETSEKGQNLSVGHEHAHGSHGEEEACCGDCALDALKGLPPCGMRGKVEDEEPDESELFGDTEDTHQWLPGSLQDVYLGGSEAHNFMSEAQLMGMKLVVILWHAPWSSTAESTLSSIGTIASEHEHIMFLRLDVDGSPDNQRFAYEKVMANATSVRKGAKPVLKKGGKWPAITLHSPLALEPIAYFQGPKACQSLCQHLEEAGPLYDPSTPEASDDEGDSSSETQESVQTTESKLITPRLCAPDSRETKQPLRQAVQFERGAADMQAHYKEAGKSAVVILIVDLLDESEGQLPELLSAWKSALQRYSDVVFCTMDVSKSDANRALAAKLAAPLGLPALLLRRRVSTSGSLTARETSKGRPSVQLLQNIRVKNLLSTIASQSDELRSTSETKPVASPAPTADATPAKPQKGSVYDPPSGAEKRPGALRKFKKKGEAIYWPRMPCLRCGCPWWLGEDWDALCVRCGWTCETEGYDDDSQPLKKGGWFERYQKYTKYLKEGRTAPWPPVKEK